MSYREQRIHGHGEGSRSLHFASGFHLHFDPGSLGSPAVRVWEEGAFADDGEVIEFIYDAEPVTIEQLQAIKEVTEFVKLSIKYSMVIVTSKEAPLFWKAEDLKVGELVVFKYKGSWRNGLCTDIRSDGLREVRSESAIDHNEQGAIYGIRPAFVRIRQWTETFHEHDIAAMLPKAPPLPEDPLERAMTIAGSWKP